MGLKGKPRKTYHSGHTISDPRNPAMVPVATRKHRRHRKRLNRVPGREAIPEDRLMLEKSVGKWALRRNVRRPQSPSHRIYDTVNNQAVNERFSGKQRRLFRIGMVGCPA